MRKTESPILAAVRDTAQGLHKAGVMDQVTLREFDPLCLPPAELQPLDGAEVGNRVEKTDGHGAEAAALGAKARH